MKKEPEKNTNRHLTQEDLEEGKEFNRAFCSLNQTGRLLVTTFMAGLKGNAVVDGIGDKKAG